MGAIWMDFDGDADLDLITANMSHGMWLYDGGRFIEIDERSPALAPACGLHLADQEWRFGTPLSVTVPDSPTGEGT